jgi:chromosome partitioning protein
MALTIAIANLKGGTGKSTLAMNLAAALHRGGHKALLVDTDSQATCRHWHIAATEIGHDVPAVVAIDGKSLRTALPAVSNGFDIVIVDTPARLGVEARAAMLAADLVLLPVTPGQGDLWALGETLAVLEDARSLRPELRAGIILNRADRTVLARRAREALAGLQVPVLATIHARVAFGEALANGHGVVDGFPDSQAAEEVQTLTAAVIEAATAKVAA